jgi:hypothetical protein
MAWGIFLNFLELFFNEERWHGMLLKFLEIFFNRERWHGKNDVVYLHVERVKINDL